MSPHHKSCHFNYQRWHYGRVWRLPKRMFVLAGLALVVAITAPSLAQDRGWRPASQGFNVITIEVFTRGDSEQSQRAVIFLRELERQKQGIQVNVHDVMEDKAALARFWSLSKRLRIQQPGIPAVYVCDRMIVGFRDAQSTGRDIQEMLTIDAFVRQGCKHCRDAKAYLAEFQKRWPGVQIRIHDAVANPTARTRWQELSRQNKVQLPLLPSFYVAGRFIVGFRGSAITGRQIESIFQPPQNTGTAHLSRSAPELQVAVAPVHFAGSAVRSDSSTQKRGTSARQNLRWLHAAVVPPAVPELYSIAAASDDKTAVDASQAEEPMLPSEIPLPGEAQLPDEAPLPNEALLPGELPLPPVVDQQETGSSGVDSLADGEAPEGPEGIEVPWLGHLRVRDVGLPTFTFLIGLIDGFNPCAMWVLIFLLTVLVNVRSRKKMILIAGTFVLVSGLAYFAFMAAWLNVFQLIGLQRPLQITLGLLAVTIGAINIKDFVAFKRGISLSIPESAKPGIYARVRQIVTAKYITAALAGAIVLAVIVNVIELLCTAGLPALYTQILTMHQLPAWQNYAYLGLYNVAYMLDDTIMLTIVVATLSHRRLQEREGRWLKLISGLVILLLGLAMIFSPDLLSS